MVPRFESAPLHRWPSALDTDTGDTILDYRDDVAFHGGKRYIPEVLLAISVFFTSPIILTSLLTHTGYTQLLAGFVPMLVMFACSMSYLILTAPGGLMQAIQDFNEGRHGATQVLFMAIMVVYVCALPVTAVTGFIIPFVLYLAFMPFNAACVLGATKASSATVTDSGVRRLRLALAVLLLLCALPWPLALMAALP